MESYSNFEMPQMPRADVERKCCKIERVTKYNCLEYFTFVCNICSTFRDDHDVYNKEEKLIGKWENCDGNQQGVKRKSDNKK